MNHTEHSMPRAGRTVDRMTVDAGWSGWHYRAPAGIADVIFATVLGICGAALLVHFLSR